MAVIQHLQVNKFVRDHLGANFGGLPSYGRLARAIA